jgi:hypothetical protein
MGRIIDRSGIQFHVLNQSRGPAVHVCLYLSIYLYLSISIYVFRTRALALRLILAFERLPDEAVWRVRVMHRVRARRPIALCTASTCRKSYPPHRTSVSWKVESKIC